MACCQGTKHNLLRFFILPKHYILWILVYGVSRGFGQGVVYLSQVILDLAFWIEAGRQITQILLSVDFTQDSLYFLECF